MSLPHEENKKYVYADYLTWPDDEKWELIDGVPYMQATPSWQHQSVSGELFRQISNYLQGKSCRVFTAPFDLRIPNKNENDEDVENVFQPDIVIVCAIHNLKGTGYYGIPEQIIEVSSPSTAKIDKILKFNAYEKAGVKEYWIVEPEGKVVSVFRLHENNRYGRPEMYTEGDTIKISVFSDLAIDLGSVFGSI